MHDYTKSSNPMIAQIKQILPRCDVQNPIAEWMIGGAHDIIRRMDDGRFERSRSLVGASAFKRLKTVHVAIFGVGGVGGWCAEALLRTGVRHITIVDDDTVAESNTNRQRQALPSTIGRPKVEVLKEMLLEIIPDATITAIPKRYTPDSSEAFEKLLSCCDFVVDAIDSVDCKAHLIQRCTAGTAGRPVEIFSSLGAAFRIDTTKVRTAPFHKIAGDGLARALRGKYKKAKIPLPKHMCAYSEELPANPPKTDKGSIMPVTCAFGMALASLVVKAVCGKPA